MTSKVYHKNSEVASDESQEEYELVLHCFGDPRDMTKMQKCQLQFVRISPESDDESDHVLEREIDDTDSDKSDEKEPIRRKDLRRKKDVVDTDDDEEDTSKEDEGESTDASYEEEDSDEIDEKSKDESPIHCLEKSLDGGEKKKIKSSRRRE